MSFFCVILLAVAYEIKIRGQKTKILRLRRELTGTDGVF